jgi:hypothetical protein
VTSSGSSRKRPMTIRATERRRAKTPIRFTRGLHESESVRLSAARSILALGRPRRLLVGRSSHRGNRRCRGSVRPAHQPRRTLVAGNADFEPALPVEGKPRGTALTVDGSCMILYRGASQRPATNSAASLLIRVGYEIAFGSSQPTAVLMMLYVHPSRAWAIRKPERLEVQPRVPISEFVDSFGNRCGRLFAPAGRVVLRNDATVEDSGQPVRKSGMPRSTMCKICRTTCCCSCWQAATARSTAN